MDQYQKSEERTIESQGCGMTVAVLATIASILLGVGSLIGGINFRSLRYGLRKEFSPVSLFVAAVGFFVMAAAYITIMAKKDWATGKPAFTRISIFAVGATIMCIIAPASAGNFVKAASGIVGLVIGSLVHWAMYYQDDDSGSCCLCFKPWISRAPPMMMPGYSYPPQVGQYPPQGYPPQAYPPQGYPPQGYPPQAYPPQGYPPQGYPPQQHKV